MLYAEIFIALIRYFSNNYNAPSRWLSCISRGLDMLLYGEMFIVLINKVFHKTPSQKTICRSALNERGVFKRQYGIWAFCNALWYWKGIMIMSWIKWDCPPPPTDDQNAFIFLKNAIRLLKSKNNCMCTCSNWKNS